MPVQSLVLLFTKGEKAYIIPKLWMRICCFIFDLTIEVHGSPSLNQQTLYMSNHISYLDIVGIGSVLKGSFLAKSEVGQWPLIGFLASLQQTAYIQRKRSKIAKEKNNIQKRIDDGDSLIIFPEGTSTSGYEALPFKSSLFVLALGDQKEHLKIQPLTLDIVSVDGKTPENKTERDIYAWPRDEDIEMHHHLWRFAKTKGAHIKLTFHPALNASNYDDRKKLAKDCHEAVQSGLKAAS